MYFDRFDICEAFSMLAHDWGLYDICPRLDRLGFRPSPILSYENLEENGREIYDYHNDLLERNVSPIRTAFK